MAALQFTRATKTAAKARIALNGPSGSGKTFTALVTAQALGGTIALIDTEHRSASLYADRFAFDTLALDRFDPAMLVEALAAAGSAGYDVVIIDSLSHFWMGVDGMLEQVDRAAKRAAGGNSFGGWKEMRPAERRMIEAILAYPGHVIATMRTKTEWVIEQNDRGKSVPRKIGTKPEQREGLEYEFSLVAELDQENELVVTKSRCPALAGAVIKKPDEQFGRTLLNWLTDGADAGPSVASLRDEVLDKHATFADIKALLIRVRTAGLAGAPVVNGTGDTVTLEELIVARGMELRVNSVAEATA